MAQIGPTWKGLLKKGWRRVISGLEFSALSEMISPEGPGAAPAALPNGKRVAGLLTARLRCRG
jgi:hypothetical protein